MPASPTGIDFSSNIPYYVQLIALIKASMRQGIWRPGDQIPGEPELCVHYGISRTVVRQALRELELEGLINRRKGKGTFVAEPKINESLAQKLTGFYQDMISRGLQPDTQVLHHRQIPADDRIAGFLAIAIGAPVIYLQRLRFIHAEPIQLVSTYVPYDLCPTLATVDLTDRSLYEFFERECGLVIARGRRYLEAVVAGETEARLLQVDRGAPLVRLESISSIADGTPVEYYVAYHRGDRTRFEVELVRGPETGASLDTLDLSPENRR